MWSEIISAHRRKTPDQNAVSFVDNKGGHESWSYALLHHKARSIAFNLRNVANVEDRVLLLFEPGLDFVAAFLGTLYAGLVAVPCYPLDPYNPKRSEQRLSRIAADCKPQLVLSSVKARRISRPHLLESRALVGITWVTIEDLVETLPENWRAPRLGENSLAMLQYTSGSTGSPKGVVLTHSQLAYNHEMLIRLMEVSSSIKVVSWLPVYHDLGLIGCILLPLYGGGEVTLMSPFHFLRDPLSWLQVISDTESLQSFAPNFAYELCVRRFDPVRAQTLDLSRVEMLVNGAEVVRPKTLRAFAETFAPYGLSRTALRPAYGQAEAALIISGTPPRESIKTLLVDRQCLKSNVVAIRKEAGEETIELVSCGAWVHESFESDLRIINPENGEPLGERQVGEIWVRTPSIANGYWKNDEETNRTFRARLRGHGKTYTRTGDLGFIHESELYIAGRVKDLIIIRGANFHPTDIELTAQEACSQTNFGDVAAFSIDADGEERLVVLVGTRGEAVEMKVLNKIYNEISETFSIETYDVALVPRGELCRTSSGKLQRAECRKKYLNGQIKIFLSNRCDRNINCPEKLKSHSSETEIREWLRQFVAYKLRKPLESIEVDVSLLTLGLDSLALTEIAAEIEESLELEIPANFFWEFPTIKQACAELRNSKDRPRYPSRPVVGNHSRLTPMSPQQQRWWILDRLAQPRGERLVIALSFDRLVDVDAMLNSIDALLLRHEILRTYLVRHEGSIFQSVSEPVRTVAAFRENGYIDISDSKIGLDDEINRILGNQVDLLDERINRIVLLKISRDRHLLLFATHHIFFDGWSIRMLLNELRDLYERRTLSYSQAGKMLQYRDFAVWQTHELGNTRAASSVAFWEDRLPRLLGNGRAGPYAAPEYSHFRPLELRFDESSVRQLKQFVQSHDTSEFLVHLCLLRGLLWFYLDQDPTLGISMANRAQTWSRQLLGCLNTNLPFEIPLVAEHTFVEHLGKLKDHLSRLLLHQHVPIHYIITALKLTDGHLEPQVTYSHQPILPPVKFNDVTAEMRIHETEGYMPYHLTLSTIDLGKDYIARFRFNTDLFNDEQARKIIDTYSTCFARAMVAPRSSLTSIFG